MVSYKLAFLPTTFMSIAFIVSLHASEPLAVLPQGWWDRPDDELRKETLDGTSYLAMKSAMKSAPEIIHNLVEHLKDPTKYNRPEWRFWWLYGPSGSGKSTLAKAVAAYSGFDLLLRCPDDFQDGKRGTAAKKFKAELHKMSSSGAETMMLLEEGNGMLDNHNDNRYDDAETGRAVWTGSDALKGKHKSFLMVTTNIVENLPIQIKTRGAARSSKIDIPIDPEARVNMAFDVIKADGFPDYIPDITVKICLKAFLPHAKNWKCRDFGEYGFLFSVRSINAYKKVIETGRNTIIQNAKDNKNFTPDESIAYAKKLMDAYREDLCKIMHGSFIDLRSKQDDWDVTKVVLSQIDREHIAQIQNIHNQAVIAQNQSPTNPIRDLLEMFGLREPVGKSIARSMTAEQHKVIKDGKMILADLGK